VVDKSGSGGAPRGWPAAVSPPGSEGWEISATASAIRQHPVILAFVTRNMLSGAVDGVREGYCTTRRELGGLVPPEAIGAVHQDLRAEGKRLSAALRAVELVERAAPRVILASTRIGPPPGSALEARSSRRAGSPCQVRCGPETSRWFNRGPAWSSPGDLRQPKAPSRHDSAFVASALSVLRVAVLAGPSDSGRWTGGKDGKRGRPGCS
jgi:hypothetical protein